MTESLMHMKLVERLKEYVINIVSNDLVPFILTDETEAKELPPILITGKRPDLYYEYHNHLIIGEAKTEKDIRSEHSREQYISYIRYCSSYEGNALLLFAVPWTEIAGMKGLLRKLERENNCHCNINILSNMG